MTDWQRVNFRFPYKKHLGKNHGKVKHVNLSSMKGTGVLTTSYLKYLINNQTVHNVIDNDRPRDFDSEEWMKVRG